MRWSLAQPDKAPVVLTHGPADEHPVFSPDGRTLAFLGKRDEPYRQLYLLPLDGGEALKATDIDGGVRDFLWLPDGSGLILLCNLEADRILPARDPAAAVDDLFERYTRDVKSIDRMFYKMDGEGSSATAAKASATSISTAAAFACSWAGRSTTPWPTSSPTARPWSSSPTAAPTPTATGRCATCGGCPSTPAPRPRR